jgi:hypothetical protein
MQAVTALLLVALLAPAQPHDVAPISERLAAVGIDAQAARQFFDTLKAGSSAGDRSALCALVSYPLVVRSKHSRRKLTGEAGCRSAYLKVFTPPVLAAIARQEFDGLFVNSRGMMIGDGEVWFSELCAARDCQNKQMRIVAINN